MVFTTNAQLFDNHEYARIVNDGLKCIYNEDPAGAAKYIEAIEDSLPNHPVGSMLRALNILWGNIPLITVDSVLKPLSAELYKTIELAQAMDHRLEANSEAVFFEMSARGLLAEYHADAGNYMKALSEASAAYDLVKQGMKLTDEIPDFLMAVGVYNYFREKYPERHPIYKPLIWVFKKGDMKKGLDQLYQASEKGLFTRVEAAIYLSYIYLRYEYKPSYAQRYMWKLTSEFPANAYFKAKLLESLDPRIQYSAKVIGYIADLRKDDRPYFRMAGEVFNGLYLEYNGNLQEAMSLYEKGLESGSSIASMATYYRSVAHLGLGRSYHQMGSTREAKKHLEMVLEYADSENMIKEAEQILAKQ